MNDSVSAGTTERIGVLRRVVGAGCRLLASADGHQPPEPPKGFDRDAYGNGPRLPEGGGPSDFQDIRRLVVIAQIISLVSLVFGGVVLSGVAIALAYASRRRAMAGLAENQGSMVWYALTRSATVALVMSAIAFVINAIAAVYLYPIVIQSLQSGDYASLFGNAPAPSTAPNGGSSTWG